MKNLQFLSKSKNNLKEIKTSICQDVTIVIIMYKIFNFLASLDKFQASD